MLTRRLLIAGSGGSFTPPTSSGPFIVIASPDAGAWTEVLGPHAYYASGITYIGWVTGNADPNDIEIASRADGAAPDTWTGPVVLKANQSGGSTTTPDSHVAPAILVRPDGYIVAAYCAHQGPIIEVKISNAPNDIVSGFGAPVTVDFVTTGTYTYPQLAYTSANDRLWLFIRWLDGGDSGLYAQYSDDGGATWNPHGYVTQFTADLTYTAFASNGVDRIDFATTDGPSDQVGGFGLWHFYMDETGVFHDSDGTVITAILSTSEMTEIVATSGGDSYPYSVSYTADGRPVIACQSKNVDPVEIFEYRWSGSAWARHDIDTSDPISPSILSVGGGAHDPGNSLRFVSGKVIGGVQKIWLYTSTNDGVTWTGGQLTTTGTAPNSPVYVQDAGSELTWLWFTGAFVSSSDFDVGLEGVGGTGSAPTPPTVGVWGPGIGFDSRDNWQVGGPSNREVSLRFVASYSSTPVEFAVNQRWGPSGYSDGTGGEIRAAIQADDGTGDPDGTDLMSMTWFPGNPGAAEDRNYLSFSGGVPLVAGDTYHLRFTNIDASPTANWMSINLVYKDVPGAWPAERQPAFTDDFAALWRQGGVWHQPSDPGQTYPDAQQDTPVFDLVYANGGHDGQGYFGIIDGSSNYAEISGTSKMVREIVTITGGNKAVNRAGFRVMRTAGSGDLTIGIYTSGGSLVASGTVAAAGFPLASPPTIPADLFDLRWGVVDFSEVTLVSGDTYYIRASCAAGTTYWTATMQAHDIPGSGNPDWGSKLLTGCDGAGANGLGGGGEKTTNGSTWVDLYEFAATDAQAYFALV